MRYAVAAAIILALGTLFAVRASAGTTEALIEVLHEKGVIDDESYGRLGGIGDSGAAARELVEILHDQGTIDDDDYYMLTKEPVSPPETMPMASAAGDERPVEEAFQAVEKGFARLGGDTVKLRIGAWLQGGWVSDDAGTTSSFQNPASAPSASNTGNQFFVRFARPYFNFSIADKVGFRIMLDATGSPPLRDAYIYVDYIPYARITVGQFLMKFGSETWRAPFDLPTINYSMAAALIQLPNIRDIGISASGSYDTEITGLPFGAGYTVGIVNGNGINTSDNNDHKDFYGRVTLKPFVPGLQIGGSWFIGRSNHAIGGVSADRDWDRWAAELVYRPDFAEGLLIMAEYLNARRFYTAYGTNATALNRHVHQDGWYAQVSYRPAVFAGGLSFLNNVEPKFRYDTLDEDTSTLTYLTRDNTRERYTFGFNYWLNRYCRLMFDYEIVRAGTSLCAASISRIDLEDHDIFTTNFQVWF